VRRYCGGAQLKGDCWGKDFEIFKNKKNFKKKKQKNGLRFCDQLQRFLTKNI